MHWEEKLKSTQQPIVQEVIRQLSVLQINDVFEAKTLPDCTEWFSARYKIGRPDTEVQQMYYEVQSLLPAEQQPSNLPPPQGQKRKTVSFPAVATPSPTKVRGSMDLDAELEKTLSAVDSDVDGLDSLHTPQPKQTTSVPDSTEKQEDQTGEGTASSTVVKAGEDFGKGDDEKNEEEDEEKAALWPVSLEHFNALKCKIEIVPSFGPCAISIVRHLASDAPASECEGALVSLQGHASAKKRRGQDALVHDFSKGQVLAIMTFSTTMIASRMLKNISESERSSVLHEVGLKSGTRILLMKNGEVDDQTAEASDVQLGAAGKLLHHEGKSGFRSTDTYLFKTDCIARSQFLFLVTGYSFNSGYEVVPVVSQADAGSIKVLGLAVCATRKITVYREKFMPVCEITDEGQTQKQDDALDE